MEEIVSAAQVPAFGLWPDNTLAVELALACYWERTYGAMGGRIWNGVPAREIEAVMRIRRVPRRERWRTLRQVSLFVHTACHELNDHEAEQTENRSN